MLALPQPRRRRRPSLTPMIDVVFLLLVFFMLAARFGLTQDLPLSLAGGAEAYSGPPRLIEVGPTSVTLNGVPTDPGALPERLAALMETPTETILLRPTEGTDVQRLLDVIGALRESGLTRISLLEARE